MIRTPRWLLRLAPVLIAGAAMAAPADNDNTATEEFTKQANLSPAETVAQAKKLQTNMTTDLHTVEKLHERATKDKDVIKLNCLNDKITQIKAHLDVTDKSMSTLTDAVGKSDDATRQHEFTRIYILAQKVRGLHDEAEGCIGEDINFVANSGATLEIDPTIPTTDPTDNPLPAFDVVPRPTEASPTS